MPPSRFSTAHSRVASFVFLRILPGSYTEPGYPIVHPCGTYLFIFAVCYEVFIYAFFHSSDVNSWLLVGSCTARLQTSHGYPKVHVCGTFNSFIHTGRMLHDYAVDITMLHCSPFPSSVHTGCMLYTHCRLSTVHLCGPFHSFVDIGCVIHSCSS